TKSKIGLQRAHDRDFSSPDRQPEPERFQRQVKDATGRFFTGTWIRFMPYRLLCSPAPRNRVSQLAARRRGRRDELHGTRRRETLQSREGFTRGTVGRCASDELLAGGSERRKNRGQ